MVVSLQSLIGSCAQYTKNKGIQSFTGLAYNKQNVAYNRNAVCDTVSFSGNSRKNVSLALSKHDYPVEIVFSDVDGTIADEGIVPEGTKRALKQLRKNNIPVVITTGRTYGKAKEKMESMGIEFSDNDFIITRQGAIITNGNGKVLYEKLIDYDDALKVIKTAEEYKKETGDSSFELAVFIDGILYSETGEKLESAAEMPVKTDSFEELLEEKGTPAGILLCKKDSKSSADLEGMKEYFSKCLDNSNLCLFASCNQLCEFTHKDVSKGAAMAKVAEMMGIELKNAACLGDAENDVKMMEIISKAGGFSVAMGNGQKCVKDAAKFITGDVSRNGYKQAIDTILANNKRLLDA